MHDRSIPRGILRRSTRAAFGLALLAAALAPSHAVAHPLGNFTTNTYDGVTVRIDGAFVDHVVDMAEIPALQVRQRIDADGDDAVSDDEAATWARSECRDGADRLQLDVAGRPTALSPVGVGISFSEGQAGLKTLRLVCTYDTDFPPLGANTTVTFADRQYDGRMGWREIVLHGDGVTFTGGEAFAEGRSSRLTAYPDAASAPLVTQTTATVTATPGGPASPAPVVPDAAPFDGLAADIHSDGVSIGSLPRADVPEALASFLHADDLDAVAILISLGLAFAIGAVHAASPGHGKTLMAAYLVGTRGTVRHAFSLGLTVTVAHTIGVLALGATVVAAGATVPAERLFPILGLISGLIVSIIGSTLLAQRIRAARARQRVHESAEADHAHGRAHDAHGRHDHDRTADASDDGEALEGWHSHGLARHTHLPAGDDPLRWRNVFALGLVGGLVPSASAILLLAGAIAAGRPGYGMLLTIVFGAGMAVVLVGVGVLLVKARSVIERWPRADRLAPLMARMPLITAAVFLLVGGLITIQAGTQLR